MLNVVYWVRGVDYAALAVRSAASVKKCYESARVFVYTDQPYDLLKNQLFEDVFIVPAFNSSPAMVANIQAQTHFCLTEGRSAPTMFLDADVLAIRHAPLPGEEWDLLVTARDHVGLDENGQKVVGVAREMPYNYGVLLVNNTLGGLEAMLWLRERVSRYGNRLANWYGNQWALRELVGGSYQDPAPRTVYRMPKFWSVKALVEPCDTWNYTPEAEGEDLAGKYFLHPKGDRKDLFEHYAEQLT